MNDDHFLSSFPSHCNTFPCPLLQSYYLPSHFSPPSLTSFHLSPPPFVNSGLRGLTEEDAEQQLEQVIVIFRFLADKDIFESFYRSYLAKRLLGGKSASDEIEKIMIAKLKGECGQQFTSKMEVGICYYTPSIPLLMLQHYLVLSYPPSYLPPSLLLASSFF